MIFETENIEFKSQVTDDIYKEVIAFANTDGGIIYIGIDDNGNAIGIDNVDETYSRITNGIRDAIQPDITMFIKYNLQENKVVKISVSEGSYKPYYLKSKGLKPSGVYIRCYLLYLYLCHPSRLLPSRHRPGSRSRWRTFRWNG